jgi:hypothetical protein
MFRKLYYLIPVAVATSLAVSASAGTIIYHWTGAGDDTTWSDAANWDNGVPDPLNTFQIYMGFTGDVGTTINMAASDGAIASDTIYGPEWGETLNMNGNSMWIQTWHYIPMGSAGAPSTINMNSAQMTINDSLLLGTAWWFPGGPYVTMNLNGNSQLTANWFQLGGHLNINDNSVATCNMEVHLGVNASTPIFSGGLDTDATRLVDISGNGKLVVKGDISSNIQDWVNRGILEGNGVVGNISYDTTSDPGYTTITVPEPASVALLGLGGFAMMLVFRRRRSGTIS